MSNDIYKGVKVVELGTHVAIPYLTRALSDMGAEVIKVEPPRGESYRHIGKLFQLPADEENNVLFTPFNVNKKSISINLKHEDGVEAFYKLLEGADVFATNTRSKALEKLGIGLETLHEKFPNLVIVHLNGFGTKGPEKDRPGFDAAAFWARNGALGEWMYKEDKTPIKPFYGFGDAITSYQLLIGTISALYNRMKTGKGDIVRVSLFATGLWTNVAGVIRGQPQFGHKFPKSRSEPTLPTDNFFKTKDGKLILISEEHWDKKSGYYLDFIGKPELKDNPDYTTLKGAYSRLDEFTEMFDEAFAKVNSEDLAKMLDEIDTVYEFVRFPQDIYQDKQAWANGYLEEVETQDGHKFVIPTNPIEFESQEAAEATMAPLLGEDSREILKDLGYDDKEIEKMIEDKTIVAK